MAEIINPRVVTLKREIYTLNFPYSSPDIHLSRRMSHDSLIFFYYLFFFTLIPFLLYHRSSFLSLSIVRSFFPFIQFIHTAHNSTAIEHVSRANEWYDTLNKNRPRILSLFFLTLISSLVAAVLFLLMNVTQQINTIIKR